MQYMQTGTIKRKVADKGFGFIAQEGKSEDLFFHANELVNVSFDELQEGDQLSFEVEASRKDPSRLNAVNVSRIG
jgi:CspA family cold shock protein